MIEPITIILLVFLSMCFGAYGGAVWMAHRKDQERQLAIEELIFKAQISTDLTIKEKTRIKELRLIAAGYKYCQGGCMHTYFVSRVSGIRYRYPDGKVKCITLRKVATKDGMKMVCEDCLKEASKNQEEAT